MIAHKPSAEESAKYRTSDYLYFSIINEFDTYLILIKMFKRERNTTHPKSL